MDNSLRHGAASAIQQAEPTPYETRGTPMRMILLTVGTLISLAGSTLTAASQPNPETLRLPDGKWLFTDKTTLGEGTSGSLLRELHGSLMLSAQSDGKQRVPFYLICKLENTDEKRHVRYSIQFTPPVPPIKDSSGALVYHYKISHVWDRYYGRVSVAREFGPVSVHDNYADSVEVSPDFVDWFLRPDPDKATQGFQIEYQQTYIKLRNGRVVPKHRCSNMWWLAEDEIGRARFPSWNGPCVDCTFLD